MNHVQVGLHCSVSFNVTTFGLHYAAEMSVEACTRSTYSLLWDSVPLPDKAGLEAVQVLVGLAVDLGLEDGPEGKVQWI